MIHMDITPDLEEDLETRIIQLNLDLDNRRTIRLMFDSDDISSIVNNLIDKGMQASITNKKDVKSLMMKSALNAALIGIGPYLIDMFWTGEPATEHKPKPGRKDDLIEWYARFIVSQLLTLIKNAEHKLRLIGRTTGINDDTNEATVKIIGLRTEPVSRQCTDNRTTEQEQSDR